MLQKHSVHDFFKEYITVGDEIAVMAQTKGD